MATAAELKLHVAERLSDQGSNNFTSYLSGCALQFPAASWYRARKAGLTFAEMLDRVEASGFGVLGDLIKGLGLVSMEMSSLYRPGRGPHGAGRGLDIVGAEKTGGRSVRFATGYSASEPALAKEVREHLVKQPKTTQVIGPWFICTNKPTWKANEGKTSLEKIHLGHLHVTVAP